MYRDKKKRIIILVTLIILLGIMTIGYAAFQAQLSIKGNSKITSNWDIRITNVTETKKTGSGESTNPPTWTHLTANMEADLYEKGDSVEYEVTIENKGSLDAKLDDIISNIKSNNEAVKISFEGYIKGEKLFKGETKIITVKIEYNPDFNGKAEEGSGEIEVSFDYTQAEGGSIVLPETYLLTYDSNGGKSNANNEYLEEGANVNLNYIATKDKYQFIGWNTNKEATEGLDSFKMPKINTTLYAIYKILDETPPIIDNVSTSSTTNSITVVVSAHDDETAITKYEFAINDGEYIDNGNNNVYTFEGLTAETLYKIKVRVTNTLDLQSDTQNSQSDATTKQLQVPTFEESNQGEVKINYPAGCGSTYTCSYIKDGGQEVTVSANPTVYFGKSGNVIAKITDGINSATSSTYSITRNDFYVSSSGNDTNGYGTINKPYATIAKAYNETETTSTINVMNNITQTSALNLNETKTVTIKSYGTSVNSIIRGSAFTGNVVNLTNGTLNLQNITLDGNNVSAQGSLIGVNGDSAILNANDKTTLQNNNNGFVYQNDGTNLDKLAGAISANKGTVTIKNAQILNNTGDYGGAIYHNSSKALTISGTTFNKNTARLSGGAISSNGVINVSSSQMNNNKSNGTAGAVNTQTLSLNGTTISSNTAANNCGGVRTTVKLTSTNNTKIDGNKAKVGAGVCVDNGTGTIENTTISNNIASSDSGGGVKVINSANLTLTSGTISGNSATHGGGVAVFGTATFTMNGGTISGNKSTITTGEEGGGGIRSNTTTTVNIKGGTIKENTAVRNGGGIWSNGKLNVSGGTINNNTASQKGAGIYAASNTASVVTISGSTNITTNTATGDGGGIYHAGGTLNISGGTIQSNKGAGGGGITTAGTTTGTWQNMTIKNNSTSPSTGDVGGAYLRDSSNIQLKSGTVSGNSGRNGGGLGANGNAKITITGGSITGNKATGTGGGLIVGHESSSSTATIYLKGGTVSGNSAAGGGGGVQVWGYGTFDYTSGNMIDNTGGTTYKNNNVYLVDNGRYTDHQVSSSSPFTFKAADVYRISSAVNNSYVIGTVSNSNANGTNVRIWVYGGEASQKWKIYVTEMRDNKTVYTFGASSLAGNTHLWVAGNTNTTSGTNVIVWGLHGNAGGFWWIEDGGSGNRKIRSRGGSNYLDLAGGTATNGTNIQIYAGNTSNAQKWKFIGI